MGTILVVDDEQHIRTMLLGLIQGEDHEVHLAGDGYTALEILKTTDMDVVITDLLLPGMTGVELLKTIRKEFPRIQVVMITGMPTIESATEGLRLGAFDYISKPVSGDVVLKTIRNAIRVKLLNDEKERLKAENRRYQERLENLVAERTQSLKQSEQRFQDLLQSLNDIVWAATTTDPAQLLYINPAVEPIFQRSMVEFFDNPNLWTECIHPEDRPGVLEQSRNLFKSGTIQNEYRIIRPDGETRWLSDRQSVVFDPEGHPVQIGGIATDVTDRRLAEEALKEYEKAVEGTEELIAVVDQHRIYTLANSVYLDDNGSGSDTIVGSHVRTVMGSRLYDTTIKPCLDRCFRGERINHEMEHEFKGRGNRRLEVAYYPIADSTGGIDRVVIVKKDVTEKKRLQAEALQIGHLASLGELAAGIAHEINNPVNGIISYAEIIKDECEDQGRDGEIACRIIKEGERIATIVSNLLYFARDIEEEYAPVHLGTILEATLSLIGKQISKDGIKLEKRLIKELAEIRAKSREIQQVFLNIISNARYALNQKFPGMHPDKVLEISATPIEVAGTPHVRTTFYDNGTGIPDAIIHKINTPFFSTKPPGQGTGLGLSISHGIVTSHGGKLTFQSREKEFTRVIVDLPVATGPEGVI
jgi:PAS domain S-box-containing protein